MICIRKGDLHDAIHPEAYVADIVIADGCPFQIATAVETVFINGEKV